MRTGKARSEGQAFHRRLLSEYNTDITLDNYVSYFELKPIAKKVEQLRKQIAKLRQTILDNSDKKKPLHSFPSSPTAQSPTEELEALLERRRGCEEEFFAQLHASYIKVKNYLFKLETALMEEVKELRQLTEEEIRSRPEEHVPRVYIKIQSILQYRALNLAAFRKIMKKFLERCTCDSLELQHRLLAVDEVISRSTLSHPRLDLRRVALDVIALYGTVYRLTYEETVQRLARHEYQAGVNTRRILPHSDTFFFTLHFPHEERQGDFAVRILPGTTSLFCEKMICEVLQCDRYPPCCSQYANGEINMSLAETVRGDDVFVLQSLVKRAERNLSHSAALMELALMLHTAKLSSAARITAVIPYLAYTGVSSMAVVAEILETMGCEHIITVDMLSEQVEGMFSIPLECISARYEFVRFIANQLTHEGHAFDNITIVAPSGKAVKRAKDFADALMNYKKLSAEHQFVSICTAVLREGCAAPNPSAFPFTEGTVTPPPPSLEYALLSPVSEGGQMSSMWAFERALRRQGEGMDAFCAATDGYAGRGDGVVLVGDVRDRLCIIVDTVIDEAVSIERTALKLREEGASRIIVVATHFILSGEAVRRLITSPIDLVVVTDSIDQDEVFKNPLIARKLRVLPLAPLLARAIEKLHTENTLATLFEK